MSITVSMRSESPHHKNGRTASTNFSGILIPVIHSTAGHMVRRSASSAIERHFSGHEQDRHIISSPLSVHNWIRFFISFVKSILFFSVAGFLLFGIPDFLLHFTYDLRQPLARCISFPLEHMAGSGRGIL